MVVGRWRGWSRAGAGVGIEIGVWWCGPNGSGIDCGGVGSVLLSLLLLGKASSSSSKAGRWDLAGERMVVVFRDDGSVAGVGGSTFVEGGCCCCCCCCCPGGAWPWSGGGPGCCRWGCAMTADVCSPSGGGGGDGGGGGGGGRSLVGGKEKESGGVDPDATCLRLSSLVLVALPN